MKKVIRIIIIVVILGVFAGTLGFLYSKSRSKPVIYETTQAFHTDIIRKTVATGSVVPRNEIEIKPTVSGIIDQIYVVEGDMVTTGQVLARVRIVPNMVSLNAAESRVNRARIALEEARINFNRQQQLFEREVIAESEFIPFRIAMKNAEEEMATAENNLQLIRDGVSKSSVRSQQYPYQINH
jgi:HlyD family secretion protein